MIVAARDGWHRRVWAAVPFKGPAGSKRRLSGLLDEAERAALSLAMLDSVLDALLGVPDVEQVLLLTPPNVSREFAARARVALVDETFESGRADLEDGLNRALRQAQLLAEAGHADSLLIVPADLPLVRSTHVSLLLDTTVGAEVVIAPDRNNEGTNALALTPPGAIEPRFGLRSFSQHRERAQQRGWRQARVHRPGLALDLDTPDDVAELLASGRDCRAARLLRELGIPERLAGLEAAQARRTTI